jgi:hypothetical protein
MGLTLVRILLGCMVLSVCGCSSGAPASPEAGDAGAQGASDGGAATFTEVYAQIINGAPDCNGCHTPPDPTGDLDMSTQAVAYANLVGKPATAAPKCASATQLLVDPGDAAHSLLYLKVTSPPCGSQMPLDGAALTAPQVELIESWINAGALND